jgi:anti-sigma28 factor (negative regulator of flagellin synthesis)
MNIKISNSTPSYINQAYSSQKPNTVASQDLKSQKNSDEAQADRLNLSHKTIELQKIAKAMETDSVERDKYVSNIKQKVENNQYNINAELVVEKMSNSLMNEVVG